MDVACRHLAQALADHHRWFVDALIGLSLTSERRWFAHVVLGRLLLIYDLQVAGFLGAGDRWYLHSHLSQQAATQTEATFFKGFLQPLCHQGLGLPEVERPRSLTAKIGDVPYLGSQPFGVHPLEQRYPQLDLPDEPIERFLGWLAEQPNYKNAPSGRAQAMDLELLAGAYEYLMTAQTDKAIVSTSDTLQEIRRHTLDAYILKALRDLPTAVVALDAIADVTSVDALLTALDTETCRQLLTTVLPTLSVLDPACGSGRYLVVIFERLQAIYRACWCCAQASADTELQAWLRSLAPTQTVAEWLLAEQIVTQNLYGVDLQPEAVSVTQLQLWLRLLSTATTVDDLRPLPDLDFNITAGNALIGFIRVDTASFDKIVPKRSRQVDSSDTALQGNLLQPLTAASYRDTLTEQKIRVEHYQAQTRAMESEGGLPEYVQTAFLRDRIDEVNLAVQQKLNRLLWETLSYKLGIWAKAAQLTGKHRKRLLQIADVEALSPFHWGFFFNAVIQQRGGFDIVLTAAPTGTLRPHANAFYHQHEALFSKYKITLSDFRRSRRQLLRQHADLAEHWQAYTVAIACLRDFVRRSDSYQLPAAATQRSIALKLLFAQRCLALTKAGSIPPYIQ
ncbi:MAG: DNA methyltransferase [Leptolyngbyaceae cyanobacterium]